MKRYGQMERKIQRHSGKILEQSKDIKWTKVPGLTFFHCRCQLLRMRETELINKDEV